jgi:hypothetical protein
VLASDVTRAARLVFSAELAGGIVDDRQLQRREVRRALRGPLLSWGLANLVQTVALRGGVISYERTCVRPVMRARRALLGRAAYAPPRLLVRVDEFPHAQALDHPRRYGTDAFKRFDELMARHGVPYLLSVNPWISREYLDPSGGEGRELEGRELDLLASLAARGVAIALHNYTHRTRDLRPRHRSALAGLGTGELERLLERGDAVLGRAGIRPRVFVPPFNRFDRHHYQVLARRFDVVCAGPETVPLLGFWPTPTWLGEAVYLPSYPPLYGRAGQVRAGIERLVAIGASVWAPVTLHWGWELDTGDRLERLVTRLAGHARRWDEFLAAVDASR